MALSIENLITGNVCVREKTGGARKAGRAVRRDADQTPREGERRRLGGSALAAAVPGSWAQTWEGSSTDAAHRFAEPRRDSPLVPRARAAWWSLCTADCLS